MKGMPLIVFALFLDGLQALISLSLAGVFSATAMASPVVVGASGAVLGCVVGGLGGLVIAVVTSETVVGFFGGLAITASSCAGVGTLLWGVGSAVGGAVGTALVPMGIIFGFAVDICLSATMGAGLIMLLIFNGMFYPKVLLPGGISEIIPGFGLLPTWTAITIFSLLRKKKEEGGGGIVGAAAGVASAVAAPSASSIAGAVQGVAAAVPQRPVDGIQPPAAANDNNIRPEPPVVGASNRAPMPLIAANDNAVVQPQRYAA